MDEFIKDEDIVPTEEFISDDDIVSDELSDYSRGPKTRGKHKPEISKAETIARLGAKGLTSGFADELGAAGAVYGEALDDAYGMTSKFSDPNYNPKSQKELASDYRATRDQIRESDEEAKKANPKTALLAEIAGGFASPINKTPLGLNKGDKVLKSAAKLAGQGAVYGAGTSEGETVGEVAKDAAISGGITGVLGGALNSVTNKAFPAIAKYLKEKVGFNALGGQVPQVKNLNKAGLETTDITDYALNPQKIGQIVSGTPIDDVAAKGSTSKVLQAFSESGPEGMSTRNDAIKRDAGRRIGEIINTGAAVQEFNNLNKSTQSELVNAIKQKYAGELSGVNFDDTGQLTAVNKVVKYLTDVDQNGNLIANNGNPFSLSDLQRFREELKHSAYKQLKAPGVEDPAADVYKNMISILDEQIQKYLDKAGQLIDPKLLPNFNEAKNTYRLALNTENIIDNALTKEAGNNTFGLSSRIAGQGGQAVIGGLLGSQFSDDPVSGGVIGGLLGGATAQGAVKLADRYGPAIAANLGNNLTKAQPVVEKLLTNPLTKVTPAYFNHLKDALDPEKQKKADAAKSNFEKSFQSKN